MSRANPLPDVLAGRAFSVAEARVHGVSASRLRANDLILPTRGVRAPRGEAAEPSGDETHSQRLARLRGELFERAALFAPALTPDQFFSHDCGLALAGAPLPFTRAAVRALHVSARRPAGKPRREGVIGHRLQAREAARWTARGLPIEHPARMWRQAAALWHVDDLIAAGDFLVLPRNRLVTLDDLRREVSEAGDVAGGVLTRALDAIRVGAETAEETTLRLAIVRAGLPEPQLNWSLRGADGEFVARLDMAYPDLKVAVEHDGRTHAFDEAQFARDADRWDRISALGWRLVRVLSHHLHPDRTVAVRRVADALVEAGWRPGAR
ncbi:hypothetical protein [Microbacterium sp. NPDC056736]|uniref:hypothetical protein n=1 Tax=Microbacterium sp. NPDC056736 TaxID=3345932 RepID=UPI00366D39E8